MSDKINESFMKSIFDVAEILIGGTMTFIGNFKNTLVVEKSKI